MPFSAEVPAWRLRDHDYEQLLCHLRVPVLVPPTEPQELPRAWDEPARVAIMKTRLPRAAEFSRPPSVQPARPHSAVRPSSPRWTQPLFWDEVVVGCTATPPPIAPLTPRRPATARPHNFADIRRQERRRLAEKAVAEPPLCLQRSPL